MESFYGFRDFVLLLGVMLELEVLEIVLIHILLIVDLIIEWIQLTSSPIVDA